MVKSQSHSRASIRTNDVAGETPGIAFIEQQVGDRRGDVGETGAHAQIARHDARAGDEHGNVLARVVGALEDRVAAVIGGDDHEFIVAQQREQRRQLRIEGLQGLLVADHVAAVAVLHVEVDEIGEHHSPARH